MERFALLLGCSNFDDDYFGTLGCVDNDVNDFEDELIKNGNFKRSNIKKLLNRGVCESRKSIEEFLCKIGTGDFILFYYSGHGMLDRNTNKLYFIMKDTEYKTLRSSSIDKDFIYNCLEEHKPKGKVFLIDCCYSGAFAKPTKSGDSDSKIGKHDIEKSIEDGKGCYIITASRAGQTVPVGNKHSIFTEVLLEGIKTGKALKGNEIRVYPDDLFEYIKQNIKSGQTPVANFTGLERKDGLYIVIIKPESRTGLALYNKVIAEKYKRIHVIGNVGSLSFGINEIYIPLRISKNRDKAQYMNGNESIVRDSIGVEELLGLKGVNRIIVKGEPGMGKSTMLMYLLGVESTNKDDISPVLIKMSQFQNSNGSLLSYIIDEIMKFDKSIEERQLILKAIENGKILVLLDGLDEVKRDMYQKLVKKIVDFSDLYKSCKIILTSRVYGFEANTFTEYIFEIDALKIEDIEKYIKIFYYKHCSIDVANKKVYALISSIKSNDEVLKMARNPFLLSILCIVGRELDVLPKYRAELYRECATLLLEYRDGVRKNIDESCKTRIKNKMLTEIAYKLFTEGDCLIEIEYDDLIDYMDELISRDEFKRCKDCEPEDCLEYFCRESGILKEISYRKYSFAHRTFCEYYASLKLKELSFDKRLEKSKNTMWEEPIKLYSSQIKNKKDGKYFFEKLWSINKELALRCYPEMVKIIDKDFVKSLLSNITIQERIKLISDLSFVSNNEKFVNIIAIIDTLKVLMDMQKDLEVICHSILKLECIKEKVDDINIIYRIDKIIENVIGTKVKQKERYKKYIEEFMVPIKGKEFAMGSPENEAYRKNNEELHKVKLSDYKILKYQVTRSLFERVLEGEEFEVTEDESRKSWLYGIGDKAGIDWRYDIRGNLNKSNNSEPVIHVNWYEAYMFCLLLGCRLPTEAEWEFACRAGTITPFNTGDIITTEQANYDGNYPYTNDLKGRFLENISLVGKYKENEYNIFDMHGNVIEWCLDWYDENYYNKCNKMGTIENPKGPTSGLYRVLRGGSWFSDAKGCRSAHRYNNIPGYRYYSVGFRIVSDS